MAGFRCIPCNRVLALEDGDINLDVGTAIVTGYPVNNLLDPTHWLQTRITTTAGAFRLRFRLGSSLSTGDVDYAVNGFGLVNHNLDGAVVTVVKHSTTTYASGTTMFTDTLTANSGNPWILKEFTGLGSDQALDYWWIDVTGGPTTAMIGNFILGHVVNLGYTKKPDVLIPVPLHEPIITAGGYELVTKIHEPIDTKSFTFEDIATLGDDIFDRKKSASGSYPTTDSMWRAWRHMRTVDLGGSTYTALNAAGGQVPIVYHEGTENMLAEDTGRPAFYGYMRCAFMRNEFRNGKHALHISVRDPNPKGPDIKPNSEG